MAFADPQSVTISGTATPLPRTGLNLDSGKFTSGDGQVILDIQHSRGKRQRHLMRLQKQTIVSDPLVPAVNTPVSYSAHIVVDVPSQGVTAADAVALAKALREWATDARIAQVVGFES